MNDVLSVETQIFS